MTETFVKNNIYIKEEEKQQPHTWLKNRKNKSYKSNSNVLMTIQINALFEVGFALQM
jgi:hypothetical protein